MKFLSLFCGIGGIDLGFERAGWKCVGQVEKNEFCRRVLSRQWPDVRRWDDVTTLTGETIREHRGDAIWMVGGFPCKQTSVAASITGRRNGIDGADSGLWHEYLRLVREYRPAGVVIENPLGVEAWASEIQGGLAGLGYGVSRTRGTSSGVGAPHLRRRVFFVAHADGTRLPLPREVGAPQAVGVAGGAVAGNPWLSSLPGVLRVADGVPGGLDRRERIQALGNSCDPRLAECVGRVILDALGLTVVPALLTRPARRGRR